MSYVNVVCVCCPGICLYTSIMVLKLIRKSTCFCMNMFEMPGVHKFIFKWKKHHKRPDHKSLMNQRKGFTWDGPVLNNYIERDIDGRRCTDTVEGALCCPRLHDSLFLSWVNWHFRRHFSRSAVFSAWNSTHLCFFIISRQLWAPGRISKPKEKQCGGLSVTPTMSCTKNLFSTAWTAWKLNWSITRSVCTDMCVCVRAYSVCSVLAYEIYWLLSCL